MRIKLNIKGALYQKLLFIFTHILKGHGTEAQNHVVCVNAAMAIATATNKSVADSFELAKNSLMEGKALNSFKTLVTLSKKK